MTPEQRRIFTTIYFNLNFKRRDDEFREEHDGVNIILKQANRKLRKINSQLLNMVYIISNN